MITPEHALDAATSDSELVAETLAGNREAFGQIVARYQSLICSLAYSATGSLSHSEDLAQETFLTAWKQLAGLREPAKLRSWLCQIARNLTHDSLRDQSREPTYGAQTFEATLDSPAPAPPPSDQAVSKEEEAILWRSIEQIPKIYREPLVLFYREGESIQRVAEKLELSEDAVKQRLSRGRKHLAAEVTGFVEGALKQSGPGTAFTVGVLAALPIFTTSASAATIAATAAKASTSAKTAGVMGIIGAILGPALVWFGMWMGYRASLDEAESNRERAYVRSFYRRLAACILGFLAIFTLLMFWARPMLKSSPVLFISLAIGTALAYVLAIVALSIWSGRVRRKLTDELETKPLAATPSRPAWEYRSRFHLLGLPLVHIRIGGGLRAQRNPVKAWLAVGDAAVGLLFAFGGVAIAPLSIGGCAIGLLPFGGFAMGALAMGGLSAGVWSFGGLALGWQAYGGCAIGWSAAMGATAIAWNFALGGIAVAAEANNSAAQVHAQAQPFFQMAQVLIRYFAWLNLIWVVPMLYWWRAIARGRRTLS